MTLNRRTIQLPTPGGPCDVYEAWPEGEGPLQGVVVLMDAGGLRDAFYAKADRLAAGGRRVVMPNLYHRQGPFAPFDFKTVFSVPAERERIMKLLSTVTAQTSGEDVGACLDHLAAQGDVAPGGACLVGYCMGGRAAFLAAATFPDRVAAAASIHGGGLVNDTSSSPHLKAGALRARLYLGVADEDGSCTPAHQAALRRALDAAGVRYEMELYAGKRHGFAVPDSPVHDAQAEARHWEKVEALFEAARRG